MGHELWAELSAAISLIDQRFSDNPHYTHPTATIVRCHLWATLHNNATRWACVPGNWDRAVRPPSLPSQPTLSRRLRGEEFERFMQLLEKRLGHVPGASHLFKHLDGHALPIPMHSTDRDAGIGRGVGQTQKGYKLHALSGSGPMPIAWRVAPMHKSEQEMAGRMIRDLPHPGYIATDKNYDSNPLFDQALKVDNKLVCQRRYGATKGLGHRRHSPQRLHCQTMLEGPTSELNPMGRTLLRQRTQIERDFGNLSSFSGGLQSLPPWVRTYGRVRRYVWAKLLINAARIRRRAKRRKVALGE